MFYHTLKYTLRREHAYELILCNSSPVNISPNTFVKIIQYSAVSINNKNNTKRKCYVMSEEICNDRVCSNTHTAIADRFD